jgi:beta-lactamase class A
MQNDFDPVRRRLLMGVSLTLTSTRLRANPGSPTDFADRVSALERETGGRIGVAALDTETGVQINHRADERFAMCSTFKLMLAAAVLSRVDSGALRLSQRLRYTADSVLSNSPITAAHLQEGALPVGVLAQAIVEVSDNTAANLLLELIGGPAGYTAYLRNLGDELTRLDRVELDLNSNLPSDPRDTTTPAAMLADMNKSLVGNSLAMHSRKRLLDWMRDCRTGRERLRAGVPASWSAGDKTGTGGRGAVNDLAIFWPANRRPILVACYQSDSNRSSDVLSAVHARIGAILASALT